MSNTLNKIHYCITIDTKSEIDNPVIGMEAGVIKYVSDGLDMSTGFTYENDDPVEGLWYSNIVKKDGFGKMGSSIDIIAGGDYAFLQSFALTLVNKTTSGSAYHKELYNAEATVVGADVKVYVIIDGVLYSRWSGSASGVIFNDREFTFQCKDSHNNINNTLNDVSFGMIKRLTIVVDTDSEVSPILSTPVTRVRFDSPLDDQFVLFDDEVIGYESMIEAGVGDGSFNMLTQNTPFRDPQTPFQTRNYNFVGSSIQTDSEYYQVWFQRNNSVNMDEVVYVSVSTDNDLKYSLVSYDHITDLTNGNEMTRVLVKGKCPVIDAANQFGSFEDLWPGSAADLETREFDGTVVNLFNSGVKLLDGVNKDYIVDIVDKDGNSIDLSVLSTINGETYLPFSIQTFKSFPVQNSKIAMYNDSNENFNNISLDDFTNSYRGEIEPTETAKISHLLIDLSGIAINYGNYDKVFLGTQIKRKEAGRAFRGFWDNTGINTGERFAISPWGANSRGIRDIWVDGEIVNEEVENNFVDYQNALSDRISIDIGSVYQDSKYGLVHDSSVGIVSQVAPFGLKTRFQTIGLEYWEWFDSAGSSNLPESLYLYSADFPSILVNSGFSISNNVLRSSNIEREFQFFQTLDLSSDDTAPDIREVIALGQYLVANVVSEATAESRYLHSTVAGSDPVYKVTLANARPLAVPALIDFSIVGQNNNAAADLFGVYNDTTTNTIGEVLALLSGATGIEDIRPSYYVGKYIDSQVSKFNIITQLCQQSFIAGYTDRLGNSVFKKINEFGDSPLIHDNSNIIDKSIKNFKHSPISKVYNEFEVKYCYEDGKPQKTLEVHNVDQDTFPTNPFVPGHDLAINSVFTFTNATTCIESSLRILEANYVNGGYDFQIGDIIEMTFVQNIDKDPTFSGDYVGEVVAVVDENLDKRIDTIAVSGTNLVSTETVFPDIAAITDSILIETSFDSPTTQLEWQKWVVGINSYNTAKSIWERAHGAYLVTGVIQKAPSSRTDLDWAVELNWFNDETVNDSSVEYGEDYFNDLIDWTTFQKFQVNYSLPVTPETIIQELISDVDFSDPIITPDVGEVGKGWITKFEVDPKKDLIAVQITFNPDFFRFGFDVGDGVCDFIVELPGNVDTITELPGNIDTITETPCN